MRLIKTEEAVGHILCHDITQIIKDVTKDARFRKGHIVKEEDIAFLAESAYNDACRPGNPRDTSVEEITALYKSLL